MSPTHGLPTNPTELARALFLVMSLQGSAVHTRGAARASIPAFGREKRPVAVLEGDGFWLTRGSQAEVWWLAPRSEGDMLRAEDVIQMRHGDDMTAEGTIWFRNRRALRPREMATLRPALRLAQPSRRTPSGIAIVHPASGSVALGDDVAIYVPRLREGSVVRWRATPAAGSPIETVSRVDRDGFLQGPRPRLGAGKVRIELVSAPGSAIDRRPLTLTILDGASSLRLREAIGELGAALLMRPSADRTLALCRALARLEVAPAYAIRELSRRVRLVPSDAEARRMLEYARAL